MSEEMMDALVPFAGAVAGGAGCGFLSEKLGWRRDWIAIGAAVAGALIAANTKGFVKRFATGVAAAGASVFAVELLKRWRQGPRQSDPEKPVTRAELQKALGQSADPEPPTKDHLAEVSARLTDEERQTLEKLKASTPVPIVAQVEAQLRSMSIEDGVALLRTRILPNANAR